MSDKTMTDAELAGIEARAEAPGLEEWWAEDRSIYGYDGDDQPRRLLMGDDDRSFDAAEIATQAIKDRGRLCVALRAERERAKRAEADNEKNLRASFESIRVLSERLAPLGKEEPADVVRERDELRERVAILTCERDGARSAVSGLIADRDRGCGP